jgi:hypothetical protein
LCFDVTLPFSSIMTRAPSTNNSPLKGFSPTALLDPTPAFWLYPTSLLSPLSSPLTLSSPLNSRSSASLPASLPHRTRKRPFSLSVTVPASRALAATTQHQSCRPARIFLGSVGSCHDSAWTTAFLFRRTGVQYPNFTGQKGRASLIQKRGPRAADHM